MYARTLLLSLLVSAGVFAQLSQFRVEKVRREQLRKEHKRSILDDGSEEPPERWFVNRVDHFDKANNATYKQKYFVDAQFYKPGGPVYLYNGGEGELDTWALKGHIAELANKTSGFIVAVEHRYYGKSLPVAKPKPEDMKYLTTPLALADMAHFIRTWKVPEDLKVKLDKKTRWITVGGSYPANLAAWMRLKYPHYVFAAYASSGPVKAKLDYYEYDLAVGDALPDECANNMATIVSYVDKVLDDKNANATETLKEQFGLTGVKLDADFAGALIDIPSYAVQYGQKKWTDKLCAIPVVGKTKTDDPAQKNSVLDAIGGYKTVQQEWMKANNMTVADYNSDNPGGDRGMQSWMWQCCTEYGYWQSAPPKPMRSLRSKLVTAAYFEDYCRVLFGNNVPKHANVDFINKQYHAQSISMNRIVYVDGEYDPWRRLSVNAPEVKDKPSNPDMPRFIVEKGSHCTDLGTAKPTDSESKIKVKKAVDDVIIRWLKTEKQEMPEPGGL
jgi:pimeloyl-ACP methyl ester carboxylesterase